MLSRSLKNIIKETANKSFSEDFEELSPEECYHILEVIERDLIFRQKEWSESNADGEVSTVALIGNRNYNERHCHRCNVLFSSAKNKKRILCIKCNQYVCKGCSLWDPKCQTRSCRSCVGSDQSSPEWIHLKLLERCRRFESAKKLMAMKKGPDEYDNDIENDSGYNGPCISPVCSTDTIIIRKKTDGGIGQNSYYDGNEIDPSVLYLHEHIEAIVENLIGDSLEDVTLEPLVQNPEYERMIEIYHRRISDSLSQLIKSIQQSQANMELPFDQTPTSAHSTLKYIINELVEEAQELPYLVNRSSHSSLTSSQYFVKDEDFEEQSYEDILSTAIINRVIEKYQKQKHLKKFGDALNDIDDSCSTISRTSSVSHKEIQTDIDLIPKPAPRKVKSNPKDSSSNEDEDVEDFSWAKEFTKKLPKVQYMIEEQVEEIITTVKDAGLISRMPNTKTLVEEPFIKKRVVNQAVCAPDLSSFGAGFDFAQNHKVPFPEFGVDILEDAVVADGSDQTLLMAIIDRWERNWLFRRKKSISPFRNMGDLVIGEEPIAMLVPNPQEGVKVMIGNRDIDELSEMSEKFEDDVDSEDKSISDKTEDGIAHTDVELLNSIEQCVEKNEENIEFVNGISKDEHLNANVDFSLDECTVDLVYKSIIPTLSVSAPSEDSLASSREDLSIPLIENLPTPAKNEAQIFVEYENGDPSETKSQATNSVSTIEDIYKTTESNEKEKQLNKVLIKLPVSFELRGWEARGKANNNCISVLHQDVIEDAIAFEVKSPLVRPTFLPGTIAEREHKKWENAVHMPNNPYTAENIARRLIDRSTSFSGKSNVGSWSYSPDESIDVIDEVAKINLGPKEEHLSKYQRDYFVNGLSNNGVSRADSCPGERPNRFIGASRKNASSAISSRSSNRNSLPDLDNFRIEENLEDKVAYAVSLVNQNENKVSAIKEHIEKVKQDFIKRHTNPAESISQSSNDVEKIIPPIPSPRASHKQIKKIETYNDQTIEKLSQENKQDAVNLPDKPSITRVHSITARYLSKEFRSPSGASSIPKHDHQNISSGRDDFPNSGNNKINGRSISSADLRDSTECSCDEKCKSEKSINRCPWVDQSDCCCNFVIANNGKRKKQMSSSIASKAEFWDRRVRENSIADRSACN